MKSVPAVLFGPGQTAGHGGNCRTGQDRLPTSNRKILGVHIAGPHATDLIAEGILAIRLGATVEDLAQTIHAHPTLSEVLMETAHKAMGSPLHGLKES